jgi:serine/threonine-protein kinase
MLGNERFLREIEIAARLTHPHILPLHDSGAVEGRLFYVMPYVEGESLRQRLERESELSLEETLYIIKAVASALDYAHREGVVHRDIKPENILLHQGEPLVADFGVARALDAAGGEKLTETGLALGTPAYMSPEQAASGRLDGRSDVYSLSCVAYEMLAGTPPFTGPTARAILARHAVDKVPPLRTVRPTVPPGVEAAIERALAKVPADRFPTAGEFSSALERHDRAGDFPFKTKERWKRVLPSRRVVAVLSAIGVLGILAVLASRSRQPLLPSPALQRQITFTGRSGAPAISPDGKWLAYVNANEAGTRDPAPRFSLKVQPLPTGDPVTLADSVFGIPPVWSPDGENLMFVGRARSSWFVGIQTVARVGGRVTQVGPLSWVYGYRPDGRALIRASFDTLVIQDILSGTEIQRISLAGKASDVHAVEWAPDGSWIALCAFRLGGEIVALIKPDGSGFRVLTQGCSPRWVRDRLYFTRRSDGGSDLFRIDIDLHTGRTEAEPRLVVSGLGDGLSITRDAGTLVYSRAPSNIHVWAIEVERRRGDLEPRTRQLTSGTRWHGSPDISADGRSIAFLSDGGLYMMPFAGDSSPRWVATHRAMSSSPAGHPMARRSRSPWRTPPEPAFS